MARSVGKRAMVTTQGPKPSVEQRSHTKQSPHRIVPDAYCAGPWVRALFTHAVARRLALRDRAESLRSALWPQNSNEGEPLCA